MFRIPTLSNARKKDNQTNEDNIAKSKTLPIAKKDSSSSSSSSTTEKPPDTAPPPPPPIQAKAQIPFNPYSKPAPQPSPQPLPQPQPQIAPNKSKPPPTAPAPPPQTEFQNIACSPPLDPSTYSFSQVFTSPDPDTAEANKSTSSRNGGRRPPPPLSLTSKVTNLKNTFLPPPTATTATDIATSIPAPRPQLGRALDNLNPSLLHINPTQRLNPLIPYLRSTPYLFSPQVVPDYCTSLKPNTSNDSVASTGGRCVIYVNERFHVLHPSYILKRMKDVDEDKGWDWGFKVVLFEINGSSIASSDKRNLVNQVNTTTSESSLLYMNKLCLLKRYTLITTISPAQSARYIESFKALDSKRPETLICGLDKKLQENIAVKNTNANGKVISIFESQVSNFFTTLPGINKTDANELMYQFGTIKNVLRASAEEIALVRGMGGKKVVRLIDGCCGVFVKKRKVGVVEKIDIGGGGREEEEAKFAVVEKEKEKGGGEADVDADVDGDKEEEEIGVDEDGNGEENSCEDYDEDENDDDEFVVEATTTTVQHKAKNSSTSPPQNQYQDPSTSGLSEEDIKWLSEDKDD